MTGRNPSTATCHQLAATDHEAVGALITCRCAGPQQWPLGAGPDVLWSLSAVGVGGLAEAGFSLL